MALTPLEIELLTQLLLTTNIDYRAADRAHCSPAWLQLVRVGGYLNARELTERERECLKHTALLNGFSRRQVAEVQARRSCRDGEQAR